MFFFFQAEDGIRDLVRSRGLGDVYKRQQLGHARAAEQVGYPMEGVHLWGVLGTSVYPTDEPELPAEVHVERALGGPKASAVLAVAAGGVAAPGWGRAFLTIHPGGRGASVWSRGQAAPKKKKKNTNEEMKGGAEKREG